MNYYNEFDPFAAQWLRNLIAAGLIPDGHVDERSIKEVQPDDLEGYTQCHFFAGIGGWCEALRLAGWPQDAEVWTGSCPCQPFSDAGRKSKTQDERHLWPTWERLIAKRNPSVVFGEQTASKAGREWLAGVRVDLEALGYAVGAADLCAASVAAPHRRQRLWFVADANSERRWRGVESEEREETGDDCSLVNALRNGRGARECEIQAGGDATFWASETVSFRDGKRRRLKPGLKPVAHGIPCRVERLRGFGNAIVPRLGAKFIAAYMDLTP